MGDLLGPLLGQLCQHRHRTLFHGPVRRTKRQREEDISHEMRRSTRESLGGAVGERDAVGNEGGHLITIWEMRHGLETAFVDIPY
ncbi:hypothetical protein ATCV1_z687R [Acanthocystis turfacea chlorella virus 1]|uniref:Uncharacterized protein z687R n=1 Tax=Chlorovirus heliozoae TaxID=322019 RepID=A7K9U7_9PHYC|nr:hypothetical protein ATCV1_z687R [Acanthocystis turfacea chlorella virus 1]ABT16821.1 hypothetical protein ATCV1_z687R [Acanthocystis turfacea chlorella virus 1]